MNKIMTAKQWNRTVCAAEAKHILQKTATAQKIAVSFVNAPNQKFESETVKTYPDIMCG